MKHVHKVVKLEVHRAHCSHEQKLTSLNKTEIFQHLLQVGFFFFKGNILELFITMSLLKRDMGVSFEQTLTKDALCQVWLKLAQWIF